MEQQVDGTNGVGIGGYALQVAGVLKMKHRSTGGKDAPVDRIGKGLLLRKAEPRPGCGKRRSLLAKCQQPQCNAADDAEPGCDLPDLQR